MESQIIVVAILYSPLLAGLVFFIIFSHSRRGMVWAKRIQSNIDNKIKNRQVKRWSNPPFSEWRVPVMFLLCSSLVFILITAGFGVTINTLTGELSVIGSDWEGDFGYDAEELNEVNPMDQYPSWIYIIMVFGYYMGILAFCYLWLDYCKWKWMNIPVEYRIEIKKVRKSKEPFYLMDGRVKKDE